MLWPLHARSALSQPTNVVEGTTGEVADLPSVCLSRWLIHPLLWRAGQVKALLWPLYARSAWAQPATVVEDMKSEGATLASVRSDDVGSDSHCGGGHDK